METDFRKELEQLINKYSKENGSDTPDFILARYLENVLQNFDAAVNEREQWYDRTPKIDDGYLGELGETPPIPIADVPFPIEIPPIIDLENNEPLIDYDSTGNPPPSITDIPRTGDAPDIMPSQTSNND